MNHYNLKPARTACLTVVLMLSYFFSAAQEDTVYATSQEVKTNGLCIGCTAVNADSAINEDLNDYSTLLLGLSALGANISQALIFPSNQNLPFRTITINLARTDGLSLHLLGAVAVRTSNNGVDNDDRHLIADNALVTDPASNRVTYTFQSSKVFDRVIIELNGGILGIGSGIRIYYAYTIDMDHITACAKAPNNPLAYYPLDGNARDYGPRGLHGTGLDMSYTDSAICKKAAFNDTDLGQRFQVNDFPFEGGPITVSFWIKRSSNIPVDFADATFRVGPYYVRVIGQRVALQEDDTDFDPDEPTGSLDPDANNGYSHCVLVQDINGVRRMYTNGVLSATAINSPPEYGPRATAQFKMAHCYIDDILIYDRVLSGAQITDLYKSYTAHKN
jgi:hypothetical protein